MQFSILTTIFLAGSAAANVLLQNRQVPEGCTADNCARAVLGTNVQDPGQAQRTSDCISFLATTIATKVNGSPASTITPTAVPTYASFCSGTARYSSACACSFSPATVYTPAAKTCNADDCARAVTGTANTQPPLTARLSSCSAYTVTVTGGTTSYPTPAAFATACTNTASRFASACSCAGVNVATVTV